MKRNKILFCDAEASSLRREIFAAALVGDDNTVIFNGYYLHEELTKPDSWVAQNVKVSGKKFADRKSFLSAFLKAFEGCREKYGFGEYKSLAVCGHMPAPVEANLFQQLYEEVGMGEFAGPYHLLSTDTLLWSKGEQADSEKAYAEKHKLVMPGGYVEHSALSDTQLTRIVWEHLNRPSWLKRIVAKIRHTFTGHGTNITFIRNIYGDEILHTKYKRSVWECKDCGAVFLQEDLYEKEKNA